MRGKARFGLTARFTLLTAAGILAAVAGSSAWIASYQVADAYDDLLSRGATIAEVLALNAEYAVYTGNPTPSSRSWTGSLPTAASRTSGSRTRRAGRSWSAASGPPSTRRASTPRKPAETARRLGEGDRAMPRHGRTSSTWRAPSGRPPRA